jgi:hypothetical protein
MSGLLPSFLEARFDRGKKQGKEGPYSTTELGYLL